MLQQTQVKTVLKYYPAFIKKFPDIKSLANAPLEDVLKRWELMGYYARARNLHRAAKIVIEKYQGKLPESYDKLKSLPGIGDYIAAAISSIAFKLPFPAIDGNVRRVMARIFAIGTPTNSTKFHEKCERKLSEIFDRENPGNFNQAMMELGATICVSKKPLCTDCPVQKHCTAYASEKQQAYPVKVQKKPVPEYQIALGVLLKKDKLLITRRKPDGLLGGLWELPGGKLHANEMLPEACVREIKEEVNLEVEVGDFLICIKHAYTHFRIVVNVYACKLRKGKIRLKGPVDYRWIKSSELDQYAFPAANHKIFRALKTKIDFFKNF
jgi:A/G-specific adenine glycosylase